MHQRASVFDIFAGFFDDRMRTISTIILPVSLIFFGILLIARVIVYANADELILQNGSFVGGDFLAFWTAAKAFVQGRALEMYDPEAFRVALSSTINLSDHHMMWQYPPTAFFLFAPLALTNYVGGYVLWMATGFAALIFSLRAVELGWREVAIIVCAPISLLVLDTGQVSFYTAALMIVATFFSGSRPVIAGIAAGLLAFKPHLGVLIPLAYMAAGHWRAFLSAALTVAVMALLSTLVFGVAGWVIFYDSITRIYTDYLYDGGSTPPLHMTTLMSQMRILGFDQSVASIVHYGFAAVVGALTILTWRRCNDAAIRSAVLCAGAILVTPYAYSYEMTALMPALAAIALNARQTGWLQGERPALLLGWIMLISFRPLEILEVVQFPFIVTAGCFFLVIRRAYAAMENVDYGGDLRDSASAPLTQLSS